MMVIVGLIVLGVAVAIGVVGLVNNAGPAHQLTDDFSLFGYPVTADSGALFLFGIAVGAFAATGLVALLEGARRSAERGRDARRELARSQRETAFLNREILLRQYKADGTAAAHSARSEHTPTAHPRSGSAGRWRADNWSTPHAVDQTR